MDTAVASQLALLLRRSRRFGLKLRADVEQDRIVFSGGQQGPHSLAIDVSSAERVLAHWEGYCENNGLPRPAPGDQVEFYGPTGKRYVGTVAKVGPKRVYLDFKYRHGGAAKTLAVPVGGVVLLPSKGAKS